MAAVSDFGANTFLLNMGGIVAQYPTRIPFHYASAFLPPGRDLFGEVLREAHARRIRVIGRFDLSKTQKPVFDAHPEWFFKRANGEPAIYNGLYSTCINGNYYREHALTILAEALDRYEVDGLFFNMFGNPSADYSGVPMGPCQCDACQARYRARYRRDVPATADADYRTFMADSAREVAATIAELIHRKRPRAAFLTYIKDHTDGIMSESNTAVGRALPLWPYSASDNVGRSLGSEPDKLAINLSMNFVDYPWRYASVPQPEIQLRLYQNMAHGGPPAVAVVGTMNQEDRQGLLAAKPIFQWHARHEDLYVGTGNAGRVLLLATEDTAVFPRVLPAAERAAHPVRRLRKPPVDGRPVAPVRPRDRPRAGLPEALEQIRARWRAAAGCGDDATGRCPSATWWAAGPRKAIGACTITTTLPSLRDTNLLFVDGDYVELAPIDPPLLTLVPAAMFGPPEKVWSDKVETRVPGLVFADHGKGRVAYIPWNVGALYYRHSSQSHAGLMADVIDRLLPGGRQLKTDAHPLVEMTRHGSAGASADAGAPRQRHRPPGHWLLSTGGAAEHPNRALP